MHSVALWHKEGLHLATAPDGVARMECKWQEAETWRKDYEQYLTWERQASASSVDQGRHVKLGEFRSPLEVQEAARRAVDEAEAALAKAKAEYQAVMMTTDCEQAASEEGIDCLLAKWKAEVGRFAASQKKMNENWDVDEAVVASAACVLQDSAECLLGLSERLNCARERGQGRYGPLGTSALSPHSWSESRRRCCCSQSRNAENYVFVRWATSIYAKS